MVGDFFCYFFKLQALQRYTTHHLFKRKTKIKTLSDSQLVQLAKTDEYAFGVLYDRHFEAVYRFVYSRVGGREELAGDLTQQTFIKAMGAIKKYENRGFAITSWFIRIAQNEINMFFRKAKKNIAVEINEKHFVQVAQEFEFENEFTKSDLELLLELINNLKPEHTDLIELRFFQKMSFKEIAEIYNVSEANAKMKVYRILEKLKRELKK